jgi:acetyl esterase/lipase
MSEEKTVIRHISKHRKPDGSFDLEGNLKIWNDALSQFELIQLWEGGAPGYDKERTPLQPEPSIAFIPSADSRARGTIIVAHGGGFESRTGCEGVNVADYFVKAGFNAAILTYRLKPYTRYDAIADMQRAIRILRSKKDELNITDKIAAMGFSAGGMLSGNCATHYDAGNPDSEDEIERYSCRPDAAVIAYGAFSMSAFPTAFMLQGRETAAERFYLSTEQNVTPETPPMFVWTTIGDDARHSFALCSALQAAGVPYELHCYMEGAHGLALADGNNDLASSIPQVASWSGLCTSWLEKLGF